MAPLAAKFCMTPLRIDGTFTVDASTIGGADLIESRDEWDEAELSLCLLLFGSEDGESDDRLELAGEGVRLLTGFMDVANSISGCTVSP